MSGFASKIHRILRHITRCVNANIVSALEKSPTPSDIMSLAGKYRTGIKDLSANHDYYLSDSW